jgi:ABC-type cobalamin/Fe3+-siderophores transport system ATPase subunit
MNLQESAAPPVLELTDVTYRRERSEIIRGVSFTVRAGERWAMLGPNGAGKSTLLGFCGAVTHPTSGTVRVLGQQLGRVELQSSTTHALLLAEGKVVAAGTALDAITAEHVSAAFSHPIDVRFDDGRWRARAARRQRAGAPAPDFTPT